MHNSERIRIRMAMTRGYLAQALNMLWKSPELVRLFPEYLILLHQIIRASVPLMEAARSEALRLPKSDALRQPLADYLAQHIEEEKDHDEWTLEDLCSIGLSPQTILDRTPMPTTASLVGAQYYWIFHHHPVGLLGYISVLESDPGTADIYDDLERRTGLPKSLFRTYRMHGELDPHHVRELDDFIDSLTLSEGHLSLIGISAMNTSIGLADCVSRLGHSLSARK
jgi:Iron-containing redox enzyme